ncbi:crotonase/enoyl-CoA hydratase family protein [Allobranchiibius sp. GilTou73]|uniref:crotonase/enoyl-CoA hydratase family protein n=1 Tax=Allobranchiibius sp. GilTou73 TaxID=2904523 RepID=UPI001F1F31D7|nr:crotonase/enoyl-CoA hydratase family protein [Allobranchiibius sp. GilTou73]UIJ35744.1 crotonase/enoyl-CoA hydratase family protein [Allobranchiibius sp. GilTou73]
MSVTCNVADGIADVRLARPEKLNALTLPMLRGLVDAGRALRSDRSVRAVVISGEGDSFCAGLDFAEAFGQPREVTKAVVPRPRWGTNTFQEACWVWRRLPVPVIAAVHGHCFGGGVQIALGADFRITTPDARWSVLEGKWGLIPDMSGIRSLAQLVGIEQAKRLTMTAEIFSGDRAREIGLVGAVGADPYADARALADQLATRSPDALAAAKRLFETRWNSGPRRTFARERIEQVRLMTGRNFKIARAAAFARETPVYESRGR